MKDMQLGQLMRFGLAGGVYLGVLVVAFAEPHALLGQGLTGIDIGLALAICLLAGSIIYPLHRSLLFPGIRRVFFLIAGERRSAIDFDMERWELSIAHGGAGSMQSRLPTWADQIHFLYCATWASLLALATGFAMGWSPSQRVTASLLLATVTSVAAIANHWQYQRYELRAIEVDRERLPS